MGVATAPTAAGMSSSTAAMRMSLRIRTMARASFFIHFLPKSIFSPFQRKTTFLVFPIYFIIVLSLWVSRDNPSAAKSLSLWERWHCGAMTERASRLSESLCAARSSAFVRARLSLCLHALVSTLALSGASRQLSQGESLGKQKAGRTGGQVCVSRILFLFCTGRRTRAPALRAGKAEQTISRFPFYK